MSISKLLFRASRASRSAEVLTGRNGVPRLAKRLVRRRVTRKVVGPLLNRLWR